MQKTCRLCFKKAIEPIDIFSAKGINLNIAETLRTHFPDEVNKNFAARNKCLSFTGAFHFQVNENDDVLPKFICTECWDKSKYFNEFYNAVAEAKNIYLKGLVKTEQPPFAEVNCDAGSEFVVLPSAKIKGDIDEDESSTGHTDNGFDSDKESLQNDDSVECGIDEQLNSIEAFKHDDNDKINCKENIRKETTPKNDLIPGGVLSAKDAAKLAIKVYKRTCTDSEKNVFKKSIAVYYDMKCEACNFQFKSFNHANEHNRANHENSKVKMKCCPQPILPSDVREHILNHMNPDLFK